MRCLNMDDNEFYLGLAVLIFLGFAITYGDPSILDGIRLWMNRL